jgi:CheY-like chemotaxis protein
MGTLQLHETSFNLDGRALHEGDALEIRVLGSWLAGTLAFDRSGWYVRTAQNVGIRVTPGLPARLVLSHPNEGHADPHGRFEAPSGTSTHEDKVILVVEDDPDLGAFLVQFFQEATPYRYAVLATDAIQALATVRSLIPDVLLVDYWLPNMDGLELYDRIQVIPELQHVPALFMSATHPRALHERQMPFLAKPFALEELVRVLATIETMDADHQGWEP